MYRGAASEEKRADVPSTNNVPRRPPLDETFFTYFFITVARRHEKSTAIAQLSDQSWGASYLSSWVAS